MPRLLLLALAVLVGIALGWSVGTLASASELPTRTVRIIQGVPTVPGIPRQPSAEPYYRDRSPGIVVRPRARVYRLDTPAPANGCARPAFEVISGPKAERGCYGAL